MSCSGDPDDGLCSTKCLNQGMGLDACNLTPTTNNGLNVMAAEFHPTPVHSAHASHLNVMAAEFHPTPVHSAHESHRSVATLQPAGPRLAAEHLGVPYHVSHRPIYDRRVMLPALPTMALEPLTELTEPSWWTFAQPQSLLPSSSPNDLDVPTTMTSWALQIIDNSAFIEPPLPGCEEMSPDPTFQSCMFEPRPQLDQHIGAATGLYVPTAAPVAWLPWTFGQYLGVCP